MTEDPYRWLEAIANRREYIRTQLAGGSPVLAASLPEGVLLLGLGSGQSKVFEIFDRQALAGLGHPADLERVRQSLIDAAHLEAFTRAPEDVSLRRLVSQGLGPQLKAAFEHIFAPPFLVRLILAEVGPSQTDDLLVKIGFDGAFTLNRAVAVVAENPDIEAAAESRLREAIDPAADARTVAAVLLQEWQRLRQADPAAPGAPSPSATAQVIEAALLTRIPGRQARFQPLDAPSLGIPTPHPTPPATPPARP